MCQVRVVPEGIFVTETAVVRLTVLAGQILLSAIEVQLLIDTVTGVVALPFPLKQLEVESKNAA